MAPGTTCLESVPEMLRVGDAGRRGRGVFAARDIEEGTLLFTELPLVAMQHRANAESVRVCAVCFRHLGGLRAQILRLLGPDAEGVDVPEVLPYEAEGFRACPEPVPCRQACGEAFCSEACEARAWEGWHELLCPAAAGGSREQEAFEAHAAGTNEAFLMAARACALACQAYSRNGGDWAAAWAPLAHFERPLWWEAVSLAGQGGERGRAQMRAVLEESWGLLRALILARRPALASSPLLADTGGKAAATAGPAAGSAEGPALYAALMGAFERNNMSVAVSSPVEDYFLHVDALEEGDAKEAAQAVTGPVLDALGERYCLPAEGAGLFPLQALLNHSCEANASFIKRDEDVDGRVVLTAKRFVPHGEELVHSYIDEGYPLRDRLEMLEDYGFVCDCALCDRERREEGGAGPSAGGAGGSQAQH